MAESWCMAPQLKKQRNKSSFIPRGSPPPLSLSLSLSLCLLFLALDLRCYPKCVGFWIWAISPPDGEFFMLWHLSLQHWGKVTFCKFSYFLIFSPLCQLETSKGYEPSAGSKDSWAANYSWYNIVKLLKESS